MKKEVLILALLWFVASCSTVSILYDVEDIQEIEIPKQYIVERTQTQEYEYQRLKLKNKRRPKIDVIAE